MSSKEGTGLQGWGCVYWHVLELPCPQANLHEPQEGFVVQFGSGIGVGVAIPAMQFVFATQAWFCCTHLLLSSQISVVLVVPVLQAFGSSG